MIILIAEDDRLVRFSIKSMLADIIKEDYTILEAASGRDMIKICREKQPDLVFTDIRMPHVNGLDAIEECRKQAGNTQYVIISGYSEFEYARRGIELGIKHYLLKPVDEEQLAEVVKDIQEKIRKQKRNSNVFFQLKLLDTFNYLHSGIEKKTREEQGEVSFPEKVSFLAFGLFMRNGKKQEEDADIQKKITEEIQRLGQKLVQQGTYYGLVYSGDGTPYFVFAAGDQEKIISGIRKINTLHVKGSGARIFSFRADTMREVSEKAREIDHNYHVGMNFSAGDILDYETIQISDRGKEVLRKIREILDAWRNADGVAYKEVLNLMYREYKDEKLDLNLENIKAYCSCVTGEEITASSYKEFCRSLVDLSEKMYEQIQVEESDFIEEAKEFIQKYYMNDISISQLADQYHLTANYLSTIFRQKVGCRFIDYLTEIRITNSKRLLIQNTTASVQDIAIMVGYNSSRHFSTLFQKQTGMTPTAYRKSKL